MTDSKKCPGCGEEMNEDGFDGNYRVYICSGSCSISVKTLATQDPDSDSMSIEDLNNLSDF